MDFFLGVMTTIGGIAAIWFFVEKVPQAKVARFLRRNAPHFFPSAAGIIANVGDPPLAFKERVAYSFHELGYKYEPEFTANTNGTELYLDFLVYLNSSEVLGVGVLYCESQYPSKKQVDAIARNFANITPWDNFAAFMLVTNASIHPGHEIALEVLQTKVLAVEEVVSHAGVYQGIKERMKECLTLSER